MKVDSVSPVKEFTFSDGKTMPFVEIMSEGTQYRCWQSSVFKNLKAGDDVVGEIIPSPGKPSKLIISSVNGVALRTQGGFSGGGGGGKPAYQAQRTESFAAAYAKDLAVALITKDIIKSSAEVKSTIDYFYNIFIEKMKKD